MPLCFKAEPYTMYKEDSDALQGNDQFEGYNMDLIAAIADILGLIFSSSKSHSLSLASLAGFNYSIRLVEDGAHGTYNKEAGTWNGMIGELLSQVLKDEIVDCDRHSIKIVSFSFRKLTWPWLT